MIRDAVDVLGLAVLVAALTSCDGPGRPPKAANGLVEVAASPPDAGALHAKDADAGAVALPLIDTRASSPPSPCVGATIDLGKALSDEACYVSPPSLPRFPGAVKVTLATMPTELRDGQFALTTLSLRNTGANVESIYFVPKTNRVRLEIDLLDPRTMERHSDNPVIFPVLTTDLERWARIQIGAFGEATYQGCWRATRTTGRAVRMSRPDAIPLDPGEYQLIFWTAIAGQATSEPDRGMSPSTKVRVVAGKRCFSVEGPPCACPRPNRPGEAANHVP